MTLFHALLFFCIVHAAYYRSHVIGAKARVVLPPTDIGPRHEAGKTVGRACAP